ncbi:MAG: phosphate-binding protein, partial [Kiritimatiellales bacterium]|nr:phosphate-binding protein [Kiritimatiellales bacterium]
MKKAILSIALMAAVAVTAVAEETIVIDGSTTVGPIAKAFAEYFMA